MTAEECDDIRLGSQWVEIKVQMLLLADLDLQQPVLGPYLG